MKNYINIKFYYKLILSHVLVIVCENCFDVKSIWITVIVTCAMRPRICSLR